MTLIFSSLVFPGRVLRWTVEGIQGSVPTDDSRVPEIYKSVYILYLAAAIFGWRVTVNVIKHTLLL